MTLDSRRILRVAFAGLVAIAAACSDDSPTEPLGVPAPTGVQAVSTSATTVRVTWNQVGEADSYDVDRAEGTGSFVSVQSGLTSTFLEETGLTDLVPWPDAALRHAVVCHVRASATEPQHEHADLRYIFATGDPEAVVPENERSPLRWLDLDEARKIVGGNNLRLTLDRAGTLFR